MWKGIYATAISLKEPIMAIPIAVVAGMGRRNRSIGKAGGLLRMVPDDMRRFAAKTIGKPVIMGRKTFESVIALSGRPLADRPNIVLSRNPAFEHEQAVVCRSLASALECAASYHPEEIHIGGGPELYDQVIDRVDRLYLTLFNDDHEGEARFPSFEDEFIEVCHHGVREHEGLAYEWVDYVRRGAVRE
ncbi:dihydrofolate reductase [Pseudomonas marginalis]|uniref:dihydrofolate reductase n=3 Tax=Pseudomonas TaxID=286 RepID=A0A3M4ADK0_PSEMA|nr:dihydrofolate reductase [Pseudomonas marginalis]OAJ45755.1 hypothetical protein AO064_24765 [Pseudomonas marginalis]RMP04872.1 hypothetical protein ALQ29_04299 [Pseudomonas marginalis pv. marginalis]